MSDAGRDTERFPERVNLASHKSGLRHLRKTQDMLFERLAAAIEREYDNAHDAIALEPEQRRTEVVQSLPAEEPVGFAELAELDYDLDASWHLGLIATGTGLQPALARVKLHLACKLLLIAQGETLWIWLGAPHKLDEAQLERLLSDRSVWASLALGEARRGIEGWRQTHDEAKGALALALRRPGTIVRYADGPLLAAAVENRTLAKWLTELLAPLRNRPDGGVPLLETLRAYIDAEHTCSSAASMLGVRRQTVTNRLRTVEELLGRELRSCLADLDTALRLAELEVDDSGRVASLVTSGHRGRSYAPH
jgi:DNA-binding PucR family transcriptional regulator